MTEEREEKKDLTVLGKVVGTYTGWDGGSPGECFIFYNFVPNELGRKWLPSLPVFDTPFHCLLVNFTSGEVQINTSLDGSETELTVIDWSVFNVGVAKVFPEETWKAFEEDYVATLVKSTGRKIDQARRAAAYLRHENRKYEDSNTLLLLKDQLIIWQEETSRRAEFTELASEIMNSLDKALAEKVRGEQSAELGINN